MKKTKAKIGLIQVFLQEDELIKKDEDFGCPRVFKKINHNKYDEKCYINFYKNGWVTINYEGVTITIPEKFVSVYEYDDELIHLLLPKNMKKPKELDEE